MYRMSKQLRILVALMVLLGTSTSFLAFAQGFLQPIYRGSDAVNLVWSPDSQVLTFYDGKSMNVISSARGQWYHYDRVTGTLSQTTQWAFQPQVTVDEVNLFRPYENDGMKSFIYTSPNNDYLVYATPTPFVWPGKRRERRRTATLPTYSLPASSAAAVRSLRAFYATLRPT